MKLGDFNLLDDENAGDNLRALIDGFNSNRTDYPRDSTVHAEFAKIAAATPSAPAIVGSEGSRSYAEVASQAHRIAHLLRSHNLKAEGFVAVMAESAFDIVTSLLGILEAGGAYLPLETSLPHARSLLMLQETKARFLIGSRKHIRVLNRLLWDCPDLDVLVCPDSTNIHAESEGIGEFMREEIWDLVGDQTFDDISGGGWRSSFTGELLSREVMDEYGENIRQKLGPLLRPTDRVLEVGCASGISMFRLAPLVAHYHGTDLSARILAWTSGEIARRNTANITLQHLPAHELDRVTSRDFDVVIINSVMQCFSGLNYLRDVLRKAIDLMAAQGTVFLGNIWDQETKAIFETELAAYRLQHAADGARTKVDRSEDLFVARAFWQDLQIDWPEITAIEFSTMLGGAESELSRFGYDAILRIDKTAAVPQGTRRKRKQPLDAHALTSQSVEPIPETAGPTSLAYAIYTSGTTGRPKGVLVEHRAILRLVRKTNYLNLTPADRILMTGALAFDASTFEIWGALLNGGALCRPPERTVLDPTALRALINGNGITTLWLTSSLCNQLADTDLSLFAGLRTLLTGGEKLSAPHINRIRAAHPRLTVINGYGPTENTTFTCCHRIDRDYPDNIPLGRPIANTTVYILDANDALVPVGATGQICTGGDGLARGYLGDAELTAAKFGSDPISDNPADRLYRTGDLGRWLADGTVEYLGRRDHQVKIRGFRIELGEIEARLRQHPQVTDVVVEARDLGEGFLTLIAFTTGDASADALRAHLSVDLPDFMVPANFVPLATLPLSSNGKVDRAALRTPDLAAPDRLSPHHPPATPTEETVLKFWHEVLEQRNLSVTDNFFAVGGHSLKITKLAARLREHFSVQFPLTALFKATTVRQQAELLLDLARFGASEIDDPLVLLNPGPEGRSPVFLFPPGTGDALSFVQLAHELADYAVYGFNFITAASRLRDYADLIESTQPEGALVLGGYSAGGNLSYHVAAELERRGRTVAAIFMIDSAQVVRAIVFPPDESRQVAAAFLDHPSIQPYLSNPLLRDKAARIITAYYDHMSRTLDQHQVAANIHGIVCDESTDFHDEAGHLITRTHGWRNVTSGRYTIHTATGSHNALLYPPYLSANAKTLRDILRKIRC